MRRVADRIVLLLCAVLAQACQDEPAQPVASESGRWTVVSATRGGRPTNTLDGAYFAFDTSAQRLETNFTGEPFSVDYERSGEQLNVRGTALFDQLDVTRLTDSTLAFATNIRGTRFVFELVETVDSIGVDNSGL